ncbi:STAS/SEC14 domain-containing protein [Microbacterium sp. NPDC055910]|uniref:STAS/SEC14 domain-containing protein n=1 Tax=Microbacterium sp. NPDC055910 TaxID=3345659 RepID=UPI0035DF32AC
MIESLPDLPAGVVGFRAVGTVEASDYRNVVDPAIDAAIEHDAKVNVVFVLGEEFDRYSLGALWQNAELESRPARAWGRIALVTDHTIVGEVIHAIAFLFPCELRFFRVAALDDAVGWASAGPERS